MNTDKKFYLSEDDKMIAGVSGGLSKYLNIDVTLIRLGFVILTLFDWLGLTIYIVLALIAPSKKTLNETSDVIEKDSQDKTEDPIVSEENIVVSEEEVVNEEDIVFSEEVEPTDEENTIVTEEDETNIEPKGEKT